MRMTHLISIGVLAMAAGCGGDDDDGGGGGTSDIDACELVTQADAEALFGQPATADQGADVVDPAYLGECIWSYAAADNSNETIAIYVWDNSNGLYYNAADGSEPFAIGDEGYFLYSDLSGIDIGWRQDDVAVYLEFFSIGPMVTPASDVQDEVKGMALEASARL